MDFSKCLNKKVLIGSGVVALGILVVTPNLLGKVLPVLFVLACPLSMVFMMRGMSGSKDRSAAPGASSTEPSTTTDQQAVASQAAPSAPVDHEAELRELREEVNRLRADMRSRADESAT